MFSVVRFIVRFKLWLLVRILPFALAALAGAGIVILAQLRREQGDWGVTPADALRDLPGDDLVSGAAIVDTRSLLIGEGVTEAVRGRLVELVDGTEGVQRTTQLLTMHLGPDTVLVALKVRFEPGLTVDQVEQVTDALEQRVRAELPEMKQIFVEADGDYDPADTSGAGG